MTEILTPVSPGELLDKLTILEIKLERISDSEKLKNVRHEWDALRKVETGKIPQDPKISALRDRLLTINKELWDIEDDIRDCERADDFGDKFVQLARAVYVTNDKRAAAKKEINLFLGSALVEEKSYQDY